eukprot:12857353-Alexandrium_andersonii.AAC.1
MRLLALAHLPSSGAPAPCPRSALAPVRAQACAPDLAVQTQLKLSECARGRNAPELGLCPPSLSR